MIGADDTFVGRADEIAAITLAADQARAGEAVTVYVSGEAGSGKSTLVRHATAALTNFLALRAQADELATNLAFHVVAQLQAVDTTAPFAAGLELLDLLSTRQDEGPVLLVVEDLHWADTESRLALLTAVRRLGHDRVLTVVTSRPDPRDADDGWARFRFDPRCVHLELGAFSAADVARLADLTGAPLGTHDAERLQAHTAGLPLYVQMLLRELTPAQLAAGGAGLPAPRSLASATLARLADVSAPARELAAALAVLNQRVPLATLSRVADVDAPTDALEELLTTGFVTWTPGDASSPVAFTHPLYRTAVYDDLSPSRRRRLHLAATAVTDPDAALMHRVAAADQPDADLADALDAAGAAATVAHRAGAAAQYFVWASDVSPGREDGERRLLAAARSLLDDGQTVAAATLAPRIETCRPGAARDLVLGVLAWEQGDADGAERLTLSAIDTSDDPELTVDARLKLAAQYTARSRGPEAVVVATDALTDAPEGSELEDLAWSLRAIGIGQIEGAPRGIDALAGRSPRTRRPTPQSEAILLMTEGMLDTYSCRTWSAAQHYRAAIELGRRDAAPINLTRAHLLLAQAQFILGDWDVASVNAHTAITLIAEEPQVWNAAQAHSAATQVPAARGEWSVADAYVRNARDAAEQSDSSESVYTALLAAAAVHRARGDHAKIVTELSPLLGGNDGAAIPMFSSLSWWIGLIASLIEIGDLDDAAAQIDGLDHGSQQRGIDFRSRVAGLRGRLAAARQRPEHAAAAFRASLDLVGRDDPLLDRAGTHLEYGRLLRATGDRQGAAAQLRSARALLEPVGAAPYLDRVDAELAAVGITAGPGRSSPLSLTEREQDVVALVAQGMTNREVASELYVSQKAVEYHLRNVFGKLGITSRRQLRDRIRPETPAGDD